MESSETSSDVVIQSLQGIVRIAKEIAERIEERLAKGRGGADKEEVDFLS